MAATREAHVEFWKALAGSLEDDAGDLLTALDSARSAVGGTPLEPLAITLRTEVLDGAILSNAMARSGDCTQTMRAMVAAGEAGDVLPLNAERIVKAIGEGTFRVPGEDPPPEADPVRLWRAVGWLLSSGVPLPRVLALLDGELRSAPLRKALAETGRALADGRGFGEALGDHEEWIGARVIAAVKEAEDRGNLDRAAFAIAEGLSRSEPEPPPGRPEAATFEGDAEAYVESLLQSAILSGVSDLHLEPTRDGRGRIRLRRGDRLAAPDAPPEGMLPRLIDRLKFLGRLDIAEQRRPQDGWIEGLRIGDRVFDLRVSTVVTNLGERLTVRILNRGAAMAPLERLGFFEDDLLRMRELCARSHGLVIVAGPAGSGKTTVLYSMIREIDRDRRCVLTIEDPIHFLLPGTSQIPCGKEVGLPAADALRTAMRQDPDVIVVGEPDDPETIREALKAEKSGHLVLTQLHAENASGAVRALLDFGIEGFRINTSLTAAISLRVVRKLCPDCRREDEPDRDSWPAEVSAFMGVHEDSTLYREGSCVKCNSTGFLGRAGIFEILVPDEGFRAAVTAGGDHATLERAARATGMRPMLESGLLLAAGGETSVEEVLRSR